MEISDVHVGMEVLSQGSPNCMVNNILQNVLFILYCHSLYKYKLFQTLNK